MQPAPASISLLASKSLYAATAKDAELHGSVTTALQDGQLRTLKKDDTFAIFNHSGDAIAAPGSPEGLYNHDTRYLSHFTLAIENARPKLLSSTISDDNATLTCDLTNPDLFDPNDRLLLSQGLLHFRRSRLLSRSGLLERLAVTNFSDRSLHFRIEIAFNADYADVFEVRGAKRTQRGRDHAPKLTADRVTLGYTGLDHQTRQTTLGFYPMPRRLTGKAATFELDLAAHATSLVFIELACGPELGKHPLPDAFFFALRDGKRVSRRKIGRGAAIDTSNDVFNETLHRSVADLYMLVTSLPYGPYPYAGIPWFSTVFGRDALITALQMLWLDPALARGVLRHLAATQATEDDAAADAEPGKILHEVRRGEMAALGEVPFRRYYGSVDSTPLFVMLAGAYLERTADLDIVARLWPQHRRRLPGSRSMATATATASSSMAAERATGWSTRAGRTATIRSSMPTARWPAARSRSSRCRPMPTARGAPRPQIAAATRRTTSAQRRGRRAMSCGSASTQAFFDEELGTYVLALDGDKQPCRVRTSNAGHALFTGIALPRARRRRWPNTDAHAFVLRLGHPHRRARPRRATTR